MSIRRTEFEGVEGICLENDSISLLKMHAALLLHEGDRIICPAKRGEIGDADFTGRHESRFFPWPDYHGERLDIVGSAQEKRSEFFFLHDLERGEMRMESPAARTFFSYSFDTGVVPYAWYFASYGGWNGLYTGVDRKSVGRERVC